MIAAEIILFGIIAGLLVALIIDFYKWFFKRWGEDEDNEIAKNVVKYDRNTPEEMI